MLTGYGGGSSLAPMGATYTAAAPQPSRSTGDELAAGLIQATQVEGSNLGVAVMEVFVRRDSQGAWQRQPCVAIPSSEAQQPGPSLPFASGAALLSPPAGCLFWAACAREATRLCSP